MRPHTSGAETSEFRQVRLAQVIGGTVLGIGVGLALAGAVLVSWVVGLIGVGLAYVGGEVFEKAVAAYAQSRGAVKASALAPPSTVVSPSVRVGSGRL